MEDRRKGNIHTTPSGSGGWDTQAEGEVISHHRTKAEAEAAGREAAKQARTELKVHNKDGKISESISYGNDPYPPKG
ncbi:hypothetical protein D3C75_1095720 [compost metagenome]